MAEGLTGSLAQLPLNEILTMLSAGGQSGRLELTSAGGRGDVYLRKGAIVHATAGAFVGEEALAELLTWPGGSFRFQPQVLSPEVTIDKPLEQLFSEGKRVAADREAILHVVPSGECVPRLATEAPGHVVTLQPHEWQIIAQVNGKQTISEMAATAQADEFAFMRMVAPLVSAGLILLDTPAAKAPPLRATMGTPFFQALTTAVAAAMGPLAEIIVDDALADMGASREAFPRELVSTLAERLAAEISDTDKRVAFQQTMLSMIRQAQAA
jgi:hypothetical protein